jgi:hypothetical protein
MTFLAIFDHLSLRPSGLKGRSPLRMTNEKFSITNFQFRLALVAACRAEFFVAKHPVCPVNPVKTQILLELGRE